MHRISTAWAGIAGGLLYLFFGAAFAMTHGSTTYNRNDTWLGFDSFDYGISYPITLSMPSKNGTGILE
ncbi:hypothetical protein [Cohnella panacarvi]|uniref:hypothetical protein n=1 Tax=Cohnella panacarvi TaxID=400776 RepID=UPI00047B36E2|nr:hypothetical protein [Cohnella panacarvi]